MLDVLQTERETSGGVFPVCDVFRTDEKRGYGSMFSMLGACDKHEEGVFRFVMFF